MSKQAIATSLALTPGYVQQLMTPLQTSGLTASTRGKQGGFKLARSAETITVAEALRVMEGEVRLAPCYEDNSCALLATCPTRPMWMEAAALFDSFFRHITIADLAERAKVLTDAENAAENAAETAPARAEEKGVRA